MVVVVIVTRKWEKGKLVDIESRLVLDERHRLQHRFR